MTLDLDADQKRWLDSKHHCSGCNKTALGLDKFVAFVFVFWKGQDEKTKEPIIRDGIFTNDGKIAILRSCPACGPKIKEFRERWKEADALSLLPVGPLRQMASQIMGRKRADWNLEIGWQIFLTLYGKNGPGLPSKHDA